MINYEDFKLTKEYMEKHEKKWQKFIDNINLLNEAIDNKIIYNVDYKDINSYFSFWMQTVFDDITYNSRKNIYCKDNESAIPNDVSKAFTLLLSLNQVIALDKKLKKCVSTKNKLYIDMRKFTDEYLSLALALKTLKQYIVKGRKPSENGSKNVEININKTIRTCPCCFRQIAISKDKKHMVHHGFTRPNIGFIVGGCDGNSFPSLEDSPDGTIHMVKKYQGRLEEIENSLANKNNIKKITKHTYKGNEIITPDNVLFKQERDRYIENLEYEKKYIKKDILTYQKVIDDWENKYGNK